MPWPTEPWSTSCNMETPLSGQSLSLSQPLLLQIAVQILTIFMSFDERQASSQSHSGSSEDPGWLG